MKISVIVPVYNAEDYLNRCIKSVTAQAYSNWELILVDDGSTDSSAEIIDRAATDDARIRAIHQSNAGAGSARNNGISSASGDYIVFLDSDDYIDKDYFSLLVPHAEKNDVVFIEVTQVNEQGTAICDESVSKHSGKDIDFFIRSQMTGKIAWGGWRKAASVKLIKENDIFYTNHKIGEEALYSFKLLKAANNIGFLDEKPVYFYVNRENSLSKSADIDPWGGSAEALSEYLKETDLYIEYANTVNAFRCTALVVSIDRITQYYTRRERKEKIRQRMLEFKQHFDADKGIDTASMSVKAKIFIPFIKLGITWPIVFTSKLRQALKK